MHYSYNKVKKVYGGLEPRFFFFFLKEIIPYNYRGVSRMWVGTVRGIGVGKLALASAFPELVF